jgi:LAO/AO transport system kinase
MGWLMVSLVDGGGDKSDAAIALGKALICGETRALARAVSLVEDGAAEAESLLEFCRQRLVGKKRAFRVGITGPAGAGKSTLVDALTRALRAKGSRVGIVAVDPSSTFSGGAILGDRIRLGELTGDAGVFMRSMATRGHLGGLAAATDDVLTVMEAAGFEWLLVETTGVGQGEIEVVSLADAVAVVLVPGMGDSIQSLKAGVLEIASVYVLNKADREGVERLEAEIGEMLGLAAVVSSKGEVAPEVIKTVATTGEGVDELLGVLEAIASGLPEQGTRARAGLSIRKSSVIKSLRGAVLDHLGIAVRSLDQARAVYEAIGVVVAGVEEVPHERVRVMMLEVGDSRIELLQATEADSAVGKFLEKRGEGLHHVALRVPELEAAVGRLGALGVRLVSERIQVGAGGHRYVFVHPASANGVLLELVEAAGSGEAH